MLKPVKVKALPGCRLHVRYQDGVEGEVDLSHLAGKGVFAAWEKPGEFEKVHIGPSGALAWSEDLEICADSLYLQITGKKPEEIFPNLRPVAAHA
jgi:hypothetical protein